MIICPVTKRTIERVDNTYLVYNLIQSSDVFPPEIVDLIFKILFYNGCMILASGTIVEYETISKRSFTIFISFPFNIKNILEKKLLYPHLLSFIIHKNIKKIEVGSFYKCEYLKNINLSDNITYIGNNAYDSCKGLVSVNLPKNLKYLGDRVFMGCINLKELVLNENLEYICSFIAINSMIEEIILPKSVKVIDRYCFYNSNNLKSIKIQRKFKVNHLNQSYWDDKNDDYRVQNSNNNDFLVINIGAFWCNIINLEKISLPMSRDDITEFLWDTIFPKDTFNWNENIIDLGNGEREYVYTN